MKWTHACWCLYLWSCLQTLCLTVVDFCCVLSAVALILPVQLVQPQSLTDCHACPETAATDNVKANILCAGTTGAKQTGASTKEYSVEFTLLLRSSANRCSSWHTSVFLNIFPARAVALSPLHSTRGKKILKSCACCPWIRLTFRKIYKCPGNGKSFCDGFSDTWVQVRYSTVTALKVLHIFGDNSSAN